MRNGGELRGNSYDRAVRKDWLLSPEAGFGGDNLGVPCFHCKEPVGYFGLHVDRIIPGSKGGRYTRDNIQPSCPLCNMARSDNEDWVPV
jgi:5-methylcytosine-specific restriction endonuclease McrA